MSFVVIFCVLAKWTVFFVVVRTCRTAAIVTFSLAVPLRITGTAVPTDAFQVFDLCFFTHRR